MSAYSRSPNCATKSFEAKYRSKCGFWSTMSAANLQRALGERHERRDGLAAGLASHCVPAAVRVGDVGRVAGDVDRDAGEVLPWPQRTRLGRREAAADGAGRGARPTEPRDAAADGADASRQPTVAGAAVGAADAAAVGAAVAAIDGAAVMDVALQAARNAAPPASSVPRRIWRRESRMFASSSGCVECRSLP